MASMDGDADRLIYLENKGEKKPPLICDGDKQLGLAVMFIQEQLEMLGINTLVSLCQVTSAYANAECTRFLKANEITTVTAPTGVKNARQVASKYVIGASSEYNGHGMIQTQWDWLERTLQGKEDKPQTAKLRALLRIANPYTSDAIANLLLMEALMCCKDYSITMLSNLYKDYPSKMLKLEVANKHKFRTNWAETKVIEP